MPTYAIRHSHGLTESAPSYHEAIEALREVFGEGDEKRDPEQMKILIRRIPLICNDVKAINVGMDDIKGDIASINDNLKWAVRLIIGAVILGLLKLILIP